MTTLALSEKLIEVLEQNGDKVETERHNSKVTCLVTVGHQVFIITCEESVPDKSQPAV